MPFIRSKACHEPCAARIQKYLERDDRAIAQDFINVLPHEQPVWAEAMDALRKLAGNDKPVKGKDPVTYQHYVISPDPKDEVSLEDLCEYTQAWASHFFGNPLSMGEFAPGVLGNYQVAITYHDDNTNGVPHAHVIVNCTDMDKLKRMRISPKQYKNLYSKAQELAQERGWKHFEVREERKKPDPYRNLIPKERQLTKEERSIRAQGRYSWKQDLAEHVHLACTLSRNEKEFFELLHAMGIGVRSKPTKSDYVFAHPLYPSLWASAKYRLGKVISEAKIAIATKVNAKLGIRSDRWISSGANLADGLSKPQIRQKLEVHWREDRPFSEQMRQNVADKALSNLPNLDDCSFKSLEEHAATIKALRKATEINSREWIRCYADYKKVESILAVRIVRCKNVPELAHIADEYIQRMQEVVSAERLAKEYGIFDGVPDNPKWMKKTPERVELEKKQHAQTTKRKAAASRDGYSRLHSESHSHSEPSRSHSSPSASRGRNR